MPKTLTINGTPFQLPLPGEPGFDQPLNDGIYAMLTGLGQTDGSVKLAGWRQRAATAIATTGWGRLAIGGSLAWRGSNNQEDYLVAPVSGNDALVRDSSSGAVRETFIGRQYVQLSTTQTSFAGGAVQDFTWTVEANLPAGTFDGVNTVAMNNPGLWLFCFSFVTDATPALQEFILNLVETHTYFNGQVESFTPTLLSRGGGAINTSRLPMVVTWPVYVSPSETSATMKIQTTGTAGVNVLSGVAAENNVSVSYLGL